MVLKDDELLSEEIALLIKVQFITKPMNLNL